MYIVFVQGDPIHMYSQVVVAVCFTTPITFHLYFFYQQYMLMCWKKSNSTLHSFPSLSNNSNSNKIWKNVICYISILFPILYCYVQGVTFLYMNALLFICTSAHFLSSVSRCPVYQNVIMDLKMPSVIT